MSSKSSLPSIPRSEAVSKGYNFAATWEQNAPLTELQQAAVAALSSYVSERPYPPHLSHFSSSRDDKTLLSAFPQKESEDSLPAQPVLVNTNQFYKWFSDLESAMKSETDERYQNYANTLTEHIKTCDHVLDQVDVTLSLLNELQLQHHAVARKTKTIHDDCDRLLEENKKSTEFAEALRTKLKYFNELEKLASVFNSPNIGVGGDNFFTSLKHLDESIMYIENNSQYAESSVYLVKFRQLQSRALSSIRAHVLSVLKRAASQVRSIVQSSKGTVSESLEASVIYVRFEAAAGELKPLLEEIEGRSSRKEYLQILTECHKVYREQRLFLVKGIVRQRLGEFAKTEALPTLTRSGCGYLLQVCQLESQLLSHFFPSCSDDSVLAQLMDPLCTYLYDALRPKFIHETSLKLLCELVDVLNIELLGRVEVSAGLRPTFERILADLCERLTFVARVHIRDQITDYNPQEDLDYHIKRPETEGGSQSYYPPLERMLSLLSLLYRHLERSVFNGLAQEAIGVCSESIQKASTAIRKKASVMDGQLFLIRNLLILREQIAAFDLDFSVTHKELDFSNLLEHLRRILRGQVSLFDWSKSTSLASSLSPRVMESQIDAKKELEKYLKSACEDFIMAVTKSVVDPTLSFVTKVTAVKVAQSGDGLVSKELKDQAFATPDKVAELVLRVRESMGEELLRMINKMKLYVENPSSQAVLWRPIRSNILEAHVQMESLLHTEYSAHDIHIINMITTLDLQSHLDQLFH